MRRAALSLLFLSLISALLTACFRSPPPLKSSHSHDDAYYAELAKGYPPFEVDKSTLRVADATELNELGAWSAVIPWPHIPVSAATLPDGRILTWAANERASFPGNRVEYTYAAVWDPLTGTFLDAPNGTHDMFCAGIVMLEDGGVFVSGGHNDSPLTSIFDYRSNTWTVGSQLNRGRWYPGTVALGSGQVFTALGRGGGNYPEIFTPGQGWRVLNGANLTAPILNVTTGYQNDWLPYFHLAPDGQIFHAGPTAQMNMIDLSGNGSVTPVGAGTDWYFKYGAGVMYDEGKILIAGGGDNNASNNKSIVVDLNGASPTVTPAAPMTYNRKFNSGVVLPGGEVLVIGGNTSGIEFSDQGSVLSPELWDPATDTWRTLADLSVPRNYHSVALLMTDGRVFSGGGGLCACAADHMDAQIYSPPYLFNPDGSLAARPTITETPAAISPGTSFEIQATTGMSMFSLIKMSGTTHDLNSDLRRLELNFSETTPGRYQLSAPANQNVLTPGYWMLFALNAAGTPSVASVVQVTQPVLPQVTPLADQAGGLGDAVNLAISASDPAGGTLTFSASGLPDGLSLDPTSGVITGTLSRAGRYGVTVAVSNAFGLGTSHFGWNVTSPDRSPGLAYRYYEGQWQVLPDFATLTPVKSGLVTNFSLSPRRQEDFYGFHYRGQLRIGTPGTYTFYTNSDDGSTLYINGRLVVFNDGLHGPRERSGTVVLSAGYHALEVGFFERDGGASLSVSYAGPGLSKQPIPGAALFVGLSDAAVPVNIAYGKTAQQSSTLSDPANPVAAKAVDGNTDGTFSSGTVTHTTSEVSPWWEVDLGASFELTSVTLWNRSDCCATRLSDVHVFVSEAPFGSTDLAATQAQTGVSDYPYPGVAGRETTLAIGRRGRYLRVQLSGTNPLSLAEVQVFANGSAPVNHAPVLTDPTTRNDAEGDAITLSLQASDPDGDPLNFSASGLPADLVLDPASGLISGTLAFGSAGSYAVTVSVSDGVVSDSATFVWTVGATNRPPSLSAPADQSHDEGVTVSLLLTATDPDGDPLTYSASGLPPGLSLNAATGRISGQPATPGSYSVSVGVSDGRGGSATGAFAWTVRAVAALTLEPPSTEPVAAGVDASYSATVTGGVSPQLKWFFGDGTPETAYLASADISHSFAAPGRYVITVTARDARGQEVMRQFTQLVHAPLTAQAPAVSSGVLLEPHSPNDRVWSVNPDADTVTVLDAVTHAKLKEISVGEKPQALALAPDGRIWVSNKGAASLSLIDPESLSVTATVNLPVASQPHGLAFDPAGGAAYVVLEATGQLLKLNPTTGALQGSLSVGAHARHVSVSWDGSRVYVTRFITPPVPDEATLSPQLAGGGGEVLVVNAPALTLHTTLQLRYSDLPDAEHSGGGIPNYLAAAVISPGGASAWVPSKQDNIGRGAARDGRDLTFESTVRSVASKLELATEREDYPARVDFDNGGVPSAAAFDPYGLFLFVALEGSREVAVIEAASGDEVLRLEVGRAPQGLVVSRAGRQLFVQNFMDRTVSVFDVSKVVLEGIAEATLLATVGTVSSESLSAQVLRGKQLFYDAKDTRLARDAYISCAACHNDGDSDGRVWDLSSLGEGLRNTTTLNGRSGAQGRLHWSANFDEVQDFEGQIRSLGGGTGLLTNAQFAAYADPLGAPKAGLSSDLDALAAYVMSLSEVPASPYRSGALTSEAVAGKAVFEAVGCAACHSGTAFTNSSDTLHDIGTLKPSSGNRLGGPLTGIDTPTLRGVWQNAPYLHDGSAQDLRAAVLAHSGVGVSGADLDNLVAYLQQIDGLEPAPTPVNRAPVLTTPADQTHAEGVAVSLQLGASDPDGDPLNFSASGLPADLVLDPASGLISGTLAFGSAGGYAVTVSVSDGVLSDSATLSWTVGATNRPPSLTTPAAQQNTLGDTIGLQLVASDPDGDTLQYSAGGLPDGLTFDAATGLVAGTLTVAGNYNVTVGVTDGQGGSDNATFAWIVEAAPTCAGLSQEAEAGTLQGRFAVGADPAASGGAFIHVPLGQGDTYSLSSGDRAEFCLTVASAGDYLLRGWVYGGDGATDSFFVTVDDVPAAGYLWDTRQNLSYLEDDLSDRNGANPVVLDLTAGPHWVRIFLREDGTRLDRLELVPAATNQAPVFTPPAAQASSEGAYVTLNLSASDPNGDPLTYSATGLPPGLAFDPNTGRISGTLSYNSAGSYTVSVSVSDGDLSSSASFSWSVSDTNRRPVLSAPSAQVSTVGIVASLQISASDPDGDPLTYSASGLPNGLTLGPTSGLISGTPDTVGTFSVTIMAGDGRANASATFSWTVTAVSSCGDLLQEAEAASLSGRFVIASDAAASGGAYVYVPAGQGDNYNGPGNDKADFCFMVSEAGDYLLRGWVYGNDALSDSFFVTVDGVPAAGYLWDTLRNTSYQADFVADRDAADPVIVTLSAGEHHVGIHLREDETRLDRLELVPRPANRLPTITDPGDRSGAEGDSANWQIIASDPDGDPLTYSASGLPDGLSLNAGTGRVSGTLQSAGDYSVTVTVSDSRGGSAATTFSWTVTTVSTCGDLLQEAEHARLSGRFAIGSDPAASGGKFIYVPLGLGTGSGPGSDTAEFCFTVSQAGNYAIRGWVYGTDILTDSFFVTVDDLPAAGYLWDIFRNTTYDPDFVANRGQADPVIVALSAGEHRVGIHLREDGTRLDRLALVPQ